MPDRRRARVQAVAGHDDDHQPRLCRLLRKLGVGGALLVLPVVGLLGFAALGTAHVLGASALTVATVCLVAWRGLSHAALRPAREALYVATERAVKFKAKSFTDTFAFRGGDLASAWSFGAFSLATSAFLGVPPAALWGALGLWLSRRQRRLEQR
jgi:AAA family ATP:ADP antiporter